MSNVIYIIVVGIHSRMHTAFFGPLQTIYGLGFPRSHAAYHKFRIYQLEAWRPTCIFELRDGYHEGTYRFWVGLCQRQPKALLVLQGSSRFLMYYTV